MTFEKSSLEILIEVVVFFAVFVSLLGFFDWRYRRKIQWHRNCLITFGFAIIGMFTTLLKSKMDYKWMFWMMLLQLLLGIAWLVFLYKRLGLKRVEGKKK